MPAPLLHHLENEANLTPSQAEGVLGMVLVQLEKLLSPADFATVRDTLPDTDRLMRHAPAMGGGLLGGLAGSLGGGKAKLLMELNQGMRKLRIPASDNRRVADALNHGVRKHHPDLVPLIEKMTA